MRCPSCQFDNPAGMKFCGQCGTKLGLVCARCGAENPPGFKFCGGCGAPLATAEPASPPTPPPPPAPSHPPPSAERPALPAEGYTPPHLAAKILQSKAAIEGERKQVTVLFCDLVGSTALADRLGAESMHRLLSGFFELALAEVHRYEGTINQFLGDGFMALFGAPIAHEDHARRAVLAALGLARHVAEQGPELAGDGGPELAVRMGLNTGWVVVGGIGDQLRMDYTAVGDTTNMAARLQQLAEPGSILVSQATERLVRGELVVEPVELAYVKGKSHPVNAFKVLGTMPQHAEQTVLSVGSLSPFVGREREMALLDDLRDLAASGAGQVVGISGEAGSGKSRLLYELRSRSRRQATAWLSGRCLSYGRGVPYLPLVDMLRTAWGIEESDHLEAVSAKLRAGLSSTRIDADQATPYLLRLLGFRRGAERVLELSPQALQAHTFGVLREVLLGAGRGGLVVLDIEDLHWVDETSEELLSFLVEGLAVARALLVLTYRSGYQPRWLQKSYATQIALRRLSEADSRAVVDVVLGAFGQTAPPEDLARAVVEKAGGNPFFLEELARSLTEGRSWTEATVPDTVQGVVMARVDRLPEAHKRLLQAASVLGREFSHDLLGAVWDSPEPLAPLLDDLGRWEFLYEAPGGDRAVSFFKHALTQEAVYQSLLTSRRQALHAAAGQALERLHAERLKEVYDALAYHYSQADEPRAAVRYLALSAERAARAYAHAEAIRALEKALVHAERLPAEERDRRSLELVLQLAESLLPLARIRETLELFLHHRERVERLADPALSGRYHFWLAHTYSYLGDQEAATANAEQAIAAARSSGDLATEGRAHYVLSRDAFWAGRFPDGIEHGLRAVELLERSGERWWEGQAHSVAGFHHYVLGRFDAALASMARAEAIWKALEDPRLDPSWSAGYFRASLGDWRGGIAACSEGLERARDPLNTAAARGFLGYAYLEKGEVERAVESLERALLDLEAAGMLQLVGWFSTFLAEARLRQGRLDEARERARRGLASAEESKFRYGLGLALRALGRVAAAAGEVDEAERHQREALATFSSLAVPFEIARTRLDLAALGAERGDRAAAASELAHALALFRSLRVRWYVERAERMASELELPLPAVAVDDLSAAAGGAGDPLRPDPRRDPER